MTDEEIISIAVKTSLLNYIDNETPRRFFVSGHAELDDVVSFGRIIAATALQKESNVIRAEVEKLRAALDEIIPFAVYSLAEMNKERNTKSLKKAIAKAVAALGEEKKG